jgi:hypothetical protein
LQRTSNLAKKKRTLRVEDGVRRLTVKPGKKKRTLRVEDGVRRLAAVKTPRGSTPVPPGGGSTVGEP